MSTPRDLRAEGLRLLDRARNGILLALDESPETATPEDFHALAFIGAGYVLAAQQRPYPTPPKLAD